MAYERCSGTEFDTINAAGTLGRCAVCLRFVKANKDGTPHGHKAATTTKIVPLDNADELLALPSGDEPSTETAYSVHVKLDSRTVWYGDVDPDDSWDRPDTRAELESIKISLNPDQNSYWSGAFPVRGPVQQGQTVYPVIVTYSTGDTFGRDDGLTTCVGVELTEWEAEALAATIRNKAANTDYSYNIEYNGWSYYSGAWTGYFDYLESVDVHRVTVQ